MDKKICVYAIAKNEIKFIDRWYDSVKEADKIFVLDTGSEDDTVKKLKRKEKIIVKEDKIIPWRFDVARNKNLDMVDIDTDICICIDIDEVIIPGWRNVLEEIWDSNTTRLAYTYNWYIDENNQPKVTFNIEKIHSRIGYKWTHPVHEVLSLTGEIEENKKITDKIIVNHYPDNTKSRNSYLPLLELSVKEDSTDDRNMHYLGREYMYYKRYDEAIDTLIKHLRLPKAIWKPERAASMRFIGRCYFNMNRYDEAIMWYKKAIKEAPYLRDGYVELSLLHYNLKDYNKVIYYTNKALKITTKDNVYINEVFSWDHTIYDIRSIAYYYTNKYKAAYKNSILALKLNPTDERLINNNKIIQNKLKELY